MHKPGGPEGGKLVSVPRSVLEPWAGQMVTVQFVDFHGSVAQASALYLVLRR